METMIYGAPVTISLVFVIVITSIISLINKRVFLKLLLHPYSIVHHREYYRIFSTDLVHNDISHFMLNMVMAFFVCGNLERTLRTYSGNGSWQFISIYAASLLSGAVITVIRHRDNYDFSSAGASGSILGCMMSFMILKPEYVAFYLPVLGGIKNLYAGIFVILTLFMFQKRTNNKFMNHELHFFSSLGGIVMTLIEFPQIIQYSGG